MEDFWNRAKTFAEEAAKKSQTLTSSSSNRFADLVSETAKKSKELAADASKKAEIIKKQADDQIKSLSDSLSAIAAAAPSPVAIAAAADPSPSPEDLEKFGVTDDLRSFVKGLTSTTFQNFPLRNDESEGSGAPTVASNVRKDLNEFQERHATLVLTTVKEISRLRYELCPRAMKERHFWKIYFTLVNTHVAPYETQYMEQVQLRAAEENVDNTAEQTVVTRGAGKAEATGKNVKGKSSNASSTEQDIDTFLLGDLEDSDDAPDDGQGSFDDDFDEIGNSDVEDEKHSKRTSAMTV
ncbi:hypothetical protein TanjilG_06765 [Lupinus angustifolius]|uniref:BSD domain-containing protein n=1 Tax=Lupinus angustifolius TaxID=3871 RepID=A0A1J7HW09_LUPAN|nr:PREDICTED: uncharacterized protein LOC109355716 isoform X2 [Lupinus angustifolius]OIW04699.1 hypothetical protein TanjilG_06765 [Lupinus angustifolius]